MHRHVLPFAVAVVLAVPSTALGDGDSENFLSRVDAVSPGVDGLEIEVVEGDDALELSNETERTILVPGYDGEPYLRFASDGVVEVNQNSPAVYLNEDRYATQPPPPDLSETASPRWEVVAGGGTYGWHDHRIHWMSQGVVPPQVEDESEQTKVFDWKVPLEVGDESVAVSGTLFWTPSEDEEGGGAPIALVIGAAVLLLAGLILMIRRLRRPPSGGSGDNGVRPADRESSEAW